MMWGNRWLVFTLLLVVGAVGLSGLAGAQGLIEQPEYGQLSEVAEHAPDRIVVEFQPWVTEQQAQRVHAGLGARLIERGYGNAFHVVKAPAVALERVLAAYQRRAEVAKAEPDFIATALFTPNDPFFSPYQWNFFNHGVLSNGYPSYYGIQAQTAWNSTSGIGVIVAIIDTGVAYENYGKSYKKAPDLANTTFVPGYDFVNNDSHPNDDNGHGTHVAGTVAQSTNNAMGVAGIAYSAALMPVKVLNKNGSGYYSWIASGIRFAANNGAKVINLSLGGPTDSGVLHEAITYAYDRGVTIVAAAGNESSSTVGYPAGYDEEVIAVGATRFDGQLAYYSNFGPQVDLVAPGGDMSVDQNRDGYGDGILQQTFQRQPNKFAYYFFQGTSMAAPHVAGVAALVGSIHPAYTRDQVRTALENTADDLGAPGKDDLYGNGLLNAAAAIAY